MSNQPWECPRCERINAPFTPTCFCHPEHGLKALAKKVLERAKAPEFNPSMVAHCPNCMEMMNGLTRHICKVSM